MKAPIIRSRPSLGSGRKGTVCGSSRYLATVPSVLLAEPCSPLKIVIGYGPIGRRYKRQHPHEERKVGLIDIEIFPQKIERPAAGGHGEGQHPLGAPEGDRGLIDDFPAVGADLDGSPGRVAQVEIVRSGHVAHGHAHVRLFGRAADRRHGLEQVDERLDRFGGRGVLLLVVEGQRQPVAKLPGVQVMRLAMIVRP